MPDRHHKPALFPGGTFDAFLGGDDPARINRVAHETAQALLARVRADPDPAVVGRLVAFTDEHGIEAIAELWSRSNPKSLPGALWRISLLRLLIRQDAQGTAVLYQRGTEVLGSIDSVVAGAPIPAGPAEVTELADRILRGVFEGDFAVALDRSAAFCRVTAAGCLDIADDRDAVDPARASELTTRALRFTSTAEELTVCARLWRSDSLD
ncbi:hypothetical protein O159_22670 [Leifsonia xyli subsp. cynodontis DSM 46306]|jgi:hypothetical protein|uniref:DNA-directed RNA polymerase subunit beta n=1 Tax=Leifsonia xyli subsp. cynodontis DSM 46306 TaxID=1389489 RepID=U3PF10_LEIXC|nr:hypothetical protein [Leifsonia xyli]AGW42233.1 hypothetical protein O159_22670 [Leifsonia xyli subsp. cynodontis DSM 46306]